MGLRLQWIPKKEQYVNKAIGNACTELLITTERATTQAFNVEPRVFMNNAAGGSGTHQNVVT